MSNTTEQPPDVAVPQEILLVIAPALVGCVFSWMLYGILVVQTYFYYLTFPRDKLILKITVYGLFIIDTFQNVLCFDVAWFFLCSGWGRPLALQQFSFGFNLIPPTCGVVSLWVQIFYMYRIHVLGGLRSKKWMVVIAVIFVVSVTQAVASIYVVCKLFTFTLLPEWHKLELPIGIWNVGSTIADVLIAGSMIFLLSRFKKETVERGHKASSDILNRLIRHSIESGAMTALVVIVDTAVIYGQPNTTLFLIFSMMQTKVYTNSLMLSLNSRSKVFHPSAEDSESYSSRGTTRDHWGTARSPNSRLVHISKQTDTFGQARTGTTVVSMGPDIALDDMHGKGNRLSFSVDDRSTSILPRMEE